MGCFDIVLFNCPKCGSENHEHSKAGLELIKFNKYTLESVPNSIAESLDGKITRCECRRCNILLEFKKLAKGGLAVSEYIEE